MKNSVLIVGAGKGLSSSLAKIFHSNGYKIGLVARNINKIKNLSNEINATLFILILKILNQTVAFYLFVRHLLSVC